MAWGYGRGMGRGYGRGMGRGYGRGMGPNPYWNCRWFPWLPRWWWAYPPEMQAQMQLPQPGQVVPPMGYPGGTPMPYGPGVGVPQMNPMTKEQETQMLEQQVEFLTQQLEQIKQRLRELSSE